MWKRIGIIVVSILVSGLLLWLTLRGVPVADVWAAAQTANPFWLAAAVVVGGVGIYTRGIRWRGLVDNRISRTKAFYIWGLIQLLNQLPMRLGEVARTVLAAREGIPIVTAATSIVVERLLDMLFVLILLLFAVSQAESVPPEVGQAAAVFAPLAVIGFVVLVIFARYPNMARRLLAWILARVKFLARFPLERLLDNALEGLRPLVELPRLAHALIWTVISWLSSYLVFYFAQLALGIPADLWLFPALSLPLVGFSVAIPVTVASLGPFQGAVRLAGQVIGVDIILATAFGFVVHGVTIVFYIITGLWGFLGLGVGWGDVMRTPPKSE